MSWQPDDLEAVHCDLCGNHEVQHVYARPDGMKAVACGRCRLCFLNPRPRAGLIARFYDRDYFQKGQAGDGLGYEEYLSDANRDILLDLAGRRLDLLTRTVDLAGKRVLEVGCATGEFCHLAQQRGAAAVGIDLAADIIERARRRFAGLTFHAGPIDEFMPADRFDCICAFEVIEHVLSPKCFFEAVAARLQPGGQLILSTPNLTCGTQTGFDRWCGFHSSFEHLYFFSIDSLRQYGQQGGFALRAWYTTGGSGAMPPEGFKQSIKRPLKNLAGKIGLLRTFRRLRRRLFPDRQWSSYEAEGNQHNLTAIFIKDA